MPNPRKRKHVTTDIVSHAPPASAEEQDTPVRSYSSSDYVEILKTELEEMQQLYVIARDTREEMKQMISDIRRYLGAREWSKFQQWRDKR